MIPLPYEELDMFYNDAPYKRGIPTGAETPSFYDIRLGTGRFSRSFFVKILDIFMMKCYHKSIQKT